MADIKVRTRDGCRGGQEQFKWNDIKDQEFKDREQYLGGSTKVGTMGKFGKYHMHDWYARKRDTPENINNEKQSVQAFEEELMQEALGLKPKRLMLAKRQLTEEEVKEFLKTDSEKNADKQGRDAMGPQKKCVTNEYGETVGMSNEDFVAVAAREAPIKGLGFASHRTKKLEEIKALTLGTEATLTGLASTSKSYSSKAEPDVKSEVKQEEGKVKTEPRDDEERGAAAPGGAHGLLEVKQEVKVKEEEDEKKLAKKRRREQEGSQERRLRKASKQDKKARKAEKKLKKAEKKLKKMTKKAKSAKGKRRDSSGSSSSGSSS
mmetsp:Transcript_41649/g.109966  ORF Transcript_41649/g.109966 Transcript_41649/m.109966 type:complete len:320 (-) Transcript_41649:2-961(-)